MRGADYSSLRRLQAGNGSRSPMDQPSTGYGCIFTLETEYYYGRRSIDHRNFS
jgi:hypothetical protein